MLKALRFIVIAAVLLGVAWFIGNLPGNVTAHSGPYTVQTSVPAALVLLFIIALVFTILLRVFGGLRRAPGGFRFWRGNRRRQLGEIATQRGLVALAAGDAAVSLAEAGRARKLLGETPLVLLLTAESARLAGQTEQAQAAFKKLTTHRHMAFFGHRGLLRQQLEAGDHKAAATHALAAEDSYPGGPWLKDKRLEIAVKQQNWPAALGFTRNKAEIAAFATAASASAANKTDAIAYGKQAVKAQPALAPAVVAYAKALFAADKPRAARKVLRNGWTVAPHPLIAQAYLEPIATRIERAQAAADLVAAKPDHPESQLVLAQTALEANLPGEARRHAEAAIAAGANDGRAAAILGRLDSNPNALVPVTNAAPGWVCSACHATTAVWQPTCPHCQRHGVLTAVSGSA
jgi:HemY protein